jgi:16S rRNA (guanine1207-N2)-methyltransferase
LPPVVQVNAARSEIVYGVDASAPGPAGALVVDYDVRRLGTVDHERTRCAELSDLLAEGWHSLPRICLNLLPFTAKQQWQRDIAAAARLLDASGELVVRVPERKLVAPVQRLLRTHFAMVERSGRCELRCATAASAGDGPLPEEGGKISHRDPLSGRTLHFMTAPGLFSPDAIDPGTRLLLEVLADRPDNFSGGAVLDLGCGYGALGCTLAARGARTTMIDSDWRAVKLARSNLAANGLDGEVLIGDAAAALPPGSFALVVSNPPTHAGSAVLQGLFENAAEGGRAVVIVVRAHLNYEKWLAPRYRIEQLATKDGYKVVAFSRTS